MPLRSAIMLLAALALPLRALATPLPPVEDVAFAPKPDARLPLHARFRDAQGQPVRLGDLLANRPAVVVPAYYGCANLCTIVLRAAADALAHAGARPGLDVDVVAVSIDPLDTPASARAKQRDVLSAAPADERDGWHFLSGDAKAIASFADALGYRYTYVAAERQYAHAAGIAVVAPGGRIVRVLYGVVFPAAELRDALALAAMPGSAIGAAAGLPSATDDGSAAASRWLLCFHYDPRTGRYTFAAMNAVRSAALLALVVLVAYAGRAWRREHRAARNGGAPR